MSEAPKAVFLSYASQDAEAVARIAEALRAAGVEVWFDKNELVGGDAWDAKIRGQIASCALFVPVISAATQARLEGYFRVEWKLAARRTHAMATAKAFLLPVVIDGTLDVEAHVPDEFREVQWTRLPGGEAPEKFCARVGKLLCGESVVAGSDVGARLVRAQDEGRGRATPLLKPARAWLVPAIIGVTAVLALALWQPWRAKENPRSPISPAASIAPAAPLSETQKLLAQINAIWAKQGDATHDELLLAEDLGAQVVAKEPANADGWAAYAQATIAQAYFGSDSSRQAPALSRAQRAVSLAGEAFEPRFALAKAYRGRPTTHEEGLRLLQQLVRERPDDRRIWRELASALNAEGRYDEALAAIDRAIALPGDDPYAWNTRSGILMNAGRTEEAMAAAERSLPSTSAPRR